jgi:putative hydrolase of the HAD superfamily
LSIRAVTFDLWLTLIWDTEELNEYWRLRRLVNLHRFVSRRSTRLGHEGEEKLGFNSVRLALEELAVKVDEINEKGLDVSPKERGRMLFEILGVRPVEKSDELAERAGRILSNAGYGSKYPLLNPESKPVLEHLRRTFPRLKIGLISNAARSLPTYRRMLERFGIAQYFDTLTISCEVGYLKPRREIFEVTLQSLGVRPREVIHVGDLFRADVVGANSAGMNAALYTGLWHRYGEHHRSIPEHIPNDYRPRDSLFALEIPSLRDVQSLIRLADSR